MSTEQNPIVVDNSEQSWLLFKLLEQNFAVNCNDVMAIFLANLEVTSMGGYSSDVRGVIDFRGAVVPLLELRSVLGMPSFDQEHGEFANMVDQRMEDHRRWVTELERCIHDESDFNLATDPHQCAFGKWYDNYNPKSQSIAFDLKKIEDPHRKLHETAIDVLECRRMVNDETREEKEMVLLREAEHEYMPKVLNLLEALKDMHMTGYKEMCIVIANEKNDMMGILVDEVTSVETLNPVDSQALFQSAFSSSCVDHVARATNVKGEVFVLNRDTLYSRLTY